MTEVDFLDLQSAYDTVWRNGLLWKLKTKYNMDGNFINFMLSYFSERWNRVTYCNYSTEWMESTLGLPQGGPLMPMMWTLFMNDCDIVDDTSIVKIQLAIFADDLTIYSLPCEYTIEVIHALQNGIDKLYDFTLFNKLVMGPVKCNSISLTRKENMKAHVYEINNIALECVHHPHNPPDICMHSKKKEHKQLQKQFDCKIDQNHPSKVTPESFKLSSPFKLKVGDPHSIPLSVRILGLYFDPHLEWTQHIQQIENRVKHKLYQLQRIAYCKRFNLSPTTVWKLYLSTIRPIIEYGFAIYGSDKNLAKMEQLQNRALKIALRAKKSANSVLYQQFFDVQTIAERLDRIRVKFWTKYTRSHPSLLVYETFNDWFNYVTFNQLARKSYNLRSIGVEPAVRYNFDNHKHFAKTPLSKAYSTIAKITPIDSKIEYYFEPQFIRAPPCYATQLPHCEFKKTELLQ